MQVTKIGEHSLKLSKFRHFYRILLNVRPMEPAVRCPSCSVIKDNLGNS